MLIKLKARSTGRWQISHHDGKFHRQLTIAKGDSAVRGQTIRHASFPILIAIERQAVETDAVPRSRTAEDRLP
jgi:hypothetical protein